MNPYATFDFEHYPVVVVAFTGHKATDENFRKYLAGLHQAYEREQPFAYLFDAENAAMPGLRYQKMQAAWLKDNEALMKQYCQGTAYHIPNAFIRTALKGIFALQQQPVPYKVVGTLNLAMQWCAEITQPSN